MKIKKSLFLGAASMVALGTVLAGCGTQSSAPSNTTTPSSTNSEKPVYGGTLTLDLDGNFPMLDPARSYDTTSDEGTELFYDQLVTYQGPTNNIVPDLATYTISNGGKTYTFHIKDAKFWNGDPVTAQSFITEFERVLNPATQSQGSAFIDPLVVGSDAYAKGHASTISGMKALDSHTLQINLQNQSATFLYVLAMPFFSAVDPAYTNKHPESYINTHPMGTGAFELTSFVSGQNYVLTKNPNYFKKGIPYLNKIVFNVNTSPQAMMLHFEQGNTGLMGYNTSGNGVPPQDYLPLSTNPKFAKDLVKSVMVSTDYIGLNCKYGPTANVKVRRALEYAVNKDQIVKVLSGNAIPANQIIPPSMPAGYEKNLPADATYTYNPALAKKLLAAAGYPHGFTTTIYADNTMPTDAQMAEVVQQDFANIGVKANLNLTSWDTFLNNNETGKQDVFKLAWVEDFPDPSDFLNVLFNTNEAPVNNSTNFSNSQVDALLNKGATMPAGTARDNVYKQAQNLIMAQAPWIPLDNMEFVAAVQPWLKGYYYNAQLMDPLAYMWIAKS